MVPNRVGRKPLGLLFAEDLRMVSVSSGYFQVVATFFGWMQGDSADKVSVVSDWLGSIDASGEEFCLLCVWAPKYNGEMGMVNPTPFPVYFGLHCCEPWVAEDSLMFSKVGEKELESDGGGPGSDVQDGVVAEVSASVFHAVYIE